MSDSTENGQDWQPVRIGPVDPSCPAYPGAHPERWSEKVGQIIRVRPWGRDATEMLYTISQEDVQRLWPDIADPRHWAVCEHQILAD
jgi:hypothetical protein